VSDLFVAEGRINGAHLCNGLVTTVIIENRLSPQRAMLRFLAILAMSLSACAAGQAQSTNDEIHLRATVQAVVPLTGFSGQVTPVDVDPKFALTMHIESAVPAVANFTEGAVVALAIHSPSLLFEGESANGKTYDFVLHRKIEDGKVRFVELTCTAVGQDVLLPTARAAEEHAITIRDVRSGTAILRQQGRLTILEIKSRAGSSQRVALSHPSDYRQGTNAPSESHLVAESPNHFLIFTDTFASNPGNIQGHCGASETGERFVHVVTLETIPHETLSVLMDSCLLDLEPTSRSPEWIAKPDSAGFIGRIILSFERGTQPTAAYYVAPDGAVTRPEIDPNSPKPH